MHLIADNKGILNRLTSISNHHNNLDLLMHLWLIGIESGRSGGRIHKNYKLKRHV